ncbi:hypothetical protein COU76_02260 [Candidatus Peregrinibacteria bacterium CG10_big_fil_rev_8_21_14_0_10_49_10]|nr:MAG: hypothetical protein COU76_02260 [Candidatus Peregrinibacteria bacterium CG10_big_fil_rev_8_21_14_0_10_49_10]
MIVARLVPSPADLEFQGKHSGEIFQFQFHQHWIRLLGPIVRLCVSTMAVFGVGYSIFVLAPIEDPFTHYLVLNVLTFLFVFAQFDFMLRFYRYLLSMVVITDKKIHRIKKTLILTDEHISVDLWMMQDIQKSQNGILQNLLRFGTITLEVQETIMSLHFVPHVVDKYEEIMSLREQAREKMGYFGGVLRQDSKQQKQIPKEVFA